MQETGDAGLIPGLGMLATERAFSVNHCPSWTPLTLWVCAVNTQVHVVLGLLCLMASKWYSLCVRVFSCSVVSDSVTPWTVACRALLSMEFSRQECWSKLPFPTPDTECRYRLLITNSSFNYDILQVLQQIWISQVSPAVNMTFHSFCSPVFSFSVYIFLPIGFAFNLLQKGLNCMESWDSSHLKCRWT